MVDVHDLRDINQTRFLHLIRELQPISRAELAKYTGLRAGTVSAIVNRLIKNKLVYEGTEAPSSGGRPPRQLFINSESFYVLAIDIGVYDTAIAVSDFNGRIVKQKLLLTKKNAEKFLNEIADEFEVFIDNENLRSKLGAIGVSVPGLIDRENGNLEISPNLGWKSVPICEILTKRTGLPVFIENDANSAAFSELWYGPLSESNIKTLLFILVVEGLGTGLIINGELHIGSKLGLGGFGHMCIDPNGELCSCGRRGCWETFASERSTLERFNRVTGNINFPPIKMNELISRAKDGDADAYESIKISAEYLGEGISNLVHGLYPEAVVIGGNIASGWDLIEPIIKKRVISKYIINPEKVRIRPASMQRPSLYGAIPIALQNYFQNPTVSGNGALSTRIRSNSN